MRFTNLNKCSTLFMAVFILQGCQSLDPVVEDKNKSQALEPVIELTPMEKIHQSPNLYLNNPRQVPVDIKQQFNQATQNFNDKQWQIAQDTLMAITIAAPTLSGPWMMLGDISMAINEQEHAIAHYRQAVYVNEHNYFARNRLGALLRQSGDFTGAKVQYEQAINAWPAYGLARRNLGILLDLYFGETQKALAQYNIVSALNKLNKVKEDRQLKGWISDLSRRVKAAKKTQSTTNSNENIDSKPSGEISVNE